jgi:hypothetical protein
MLPKTTLDSSYIDFGNGYTITDTRGYKIEHLACWDTLMKYETDEIKETLYTVTTEVALNINDLFHLKVINTQDKVVVRMFLPNSLKITPYKATNISKKLGDGTTQEVKEEASDVEDAQVIDGESTVTAEVEIQEPNIRKQFYLSGSYLQLNVVGLGFITFSQECQIEIYPKLNLFFELGGSLL